MKELVSRLVGLLICVGAFSQGIDTPEVFSERNYQATWNQDYKMDTPLGSQTTAASGLDRFGSDRSQIAGTDRLSGGKSSISNQSSTEIAGTDGRFGSNSQALYSLSWGPNLGQQVPNLGNQLNNYTQRYRNQALNQLLSRLNLTRPGSPFDPAQFLNGLQVGRGAGITLNVPQSTPVFVGGANVTTSPGLSSVSLIEAPNLERVEIPSAEDIFLHANQNLPSLKAGEDMGLHSAKLAPEAGQVIRELNERVGVCANRILEENQSISRPQAIAICAQAQIEVLNGSNPRQATGQSPNRTPNANPDVLRIAQVPGFLGAVTEALKLFPGLDLEQRRNRVREVFTTQESIATLQTPSARPTSVNVNYQFTVNSSSANSANNTVTPHSENTIFLSAIFDIQRLKLRRFSNTSLFAQMMDENFAHRRRQFRLMAGDFIIFALGESRLSTTLLSATEGPLRNQATSCTREARVVNNFMINLRLLYSILHASCETKGQAKERLRTANLNDVIAALQPSLTPGSQQSGGTNNGSTSLTIGALTMQAILDNAQMQFTLDGQNLGSNNLNVGSTSSSPSSLPVACYDEISRVVGRSMPIRRVLQEIQRPLETNLISEDFLTAIDRVFEKSITKVRTTNSGFNQAFMVSCNEIENSFEKIMGIFRNQGNATNSTTSISFSDFVRRIHEITTSVDLSAPSLPRDHLKKLTSGSRVVNNGVDNVTIEPLEALIVNAAYHLAVLVSEAKAYQVINSAWELLKQEYSTITSVEKPFGVPFDVFRAFSEALSAFAIQASGNPAIVSNGSLNTQFLGDVKKRGQMFLQNVSLIAALM